MARLFGEKIEDDPSLPHFTLSKDFLLLPIIGVVATIGLMVVVKVLLVIQ